MSIINEQILSEIAIILDSDVTNFDDSDIDRINLISDKLNKVNELIISLDRKRRLYTLWKNRQDFADIEQAKLYISKLTKGYTQIVINKPIAEKLVNNNTIHLGYFQYSAHIQIRKTAHISNANIIKKDMFNELNYSIIGVDIDEKMEYD